MNGGKFASLTADLLARKGEAMPSSVIASQAIAFSRPVDQPAAPEQIPARDELDAEIFSFAMALERPAASEEIVPSAEHEKPSSPEKPDKSRRLMVTLSHNEYETLGLIAVKKATTRHRLLRLAFDEYLALLVDEYGGACRCIDSGCDYTHPACGASF